MPGAQLYQKEATKARRDQLILSHLPLVRHAIGRLAARLPSGVDVENLESAGVVGLVEAANRFDPERGIKFETYAYTRIRGAMLDELRRNSFLPQHVLENLASVRRAYQALPAPVTVEALAKATGMGTEKVTDCLAAMRWTRMTSLDDAGNAGDMQAANAGDQPAAPIEQAELQHLLARAIESLAERLRLVVTLYYLEDLRLKEIGELLGLSESRVSRLLDDALFELGEFMRAHGAEEAK
jgi:RNA polymerase sigma factor for flagellar operon FliA